MRSYPTRSSGPCLFPSARGRGGAPPPLTCTVLHASSPPSEPSRRAVPFSGQERSNVRSLQDYRITSPAPLLSRPPRTTAPVLFSQVTRHPHARRHIASPAMGPRCAIASSARLLERDCCNVRSLQDYKITPIAYSYPGVRALGRDGPAPGTDPVHAQAAAPLRWP